MLHVKKQSITIENLTRTLGFLLALWALFSLQGCGKSQSFTLYSFFINDDTDSPPPAPNSITLIKPTVTPDLDSTPTIQIGGVTSGDTIKLFSDNICSNEIGTGVATGVTINITTVFLSTGTYTIYANTKTGDTTSACSTATLNYEVVSCPTGYIPIPSNDVLGTNNFCVMKYEAKAWETAGSVVDSDGCGEPGCTTANWGVATHEPRSIEDGHPWRMISQTNAKIECTNLGANYDLISNPEWMAIARDVENTNSNWTNGTVGDGCMFRGNSGETTCGYNGPDPDSGSGRDPRAKFTLSNGEEIFDISGNVWEWTDWTTGGALETGPIDCLGGWIELDDVTMPCGSLIQADYRPTGTTYPVDYSTSGLGRFFAGAGGATLRGGDSFNITDTGTFTFALSAISTYTNDYVGLRCVWRPYVPPAPSSILLISPSGTPDLEDSPTIEVGGITSGDTVKLFTNNTCTAQIGSGSTIGATVEIVTDPLGEGSYTIYANTTSGNYISDCSTVNLSYEVVTCPTGYIPVPANDNLGTNNFCVMKYEAKAWETAGAVVDSDGCGEPACTTNNWGVATHEPRSIEDGQPWRRISQNNAKTECTNLGTGYDLISNPEWMTIARNAENVDSNWTNGTVGDGCLFRGNSGETTCGYNSATDPDSGAARNVRAKFTLSNTEEVYDISANVWEWTDWTLGGTLASGPTDCLDDWIELTDSSMPCGATLSNNDYNTFNETYNSVHGVGLFYGGAGGAAIRGCHWDCTDWTGAFSICLLTIPTDSSNEMGFRCVWRAR